MNYQQISNSNNIATYTQLQQANLDKSLAVDGTEILLDDWHVITSTIQPEYNQYTEKVIEVAPQTYIQTWEIEALTTTQIEEYIEQAKKDKYTETDIYASGLVDEANADPYVGSKTTASKNKRKVAARINHSSNGKPKSDLDKDRDDVLADYSDDVYDAQDSADDVIEDMNDAEAIYALNASIIVVWPQWSSPA